MKKLFILLMLTVFFISHSHAEGKNMQRFFAKLEDFYLEVYERLVQKMALIW